MVKYMEEEYGEQALNGDLDQAKILKAKIEELEEKIAAQKDSTAEESKGRDDMGSEDETDSDVS